MTNTGSPSLSLHLHHSPVTLVSTLTTLTAFARLIHTGASITAHRLTIDELREYHPLIWRLCGGSSDWKRHAITRDDTLPVGMVVARSNILTPTFNQTTTTTTTAITKETTS